MRDWKRHWWGYVTHWGQGAIAGWYVIDFPIPAFTLLALGVAYQWAGFVKKGDTVALDIKDIAVGYAVGVAARVICVWLTRLI